MDSLRLLSRSTRLQKSAKRVEKVQPHTPSEQRIDCPNPGQLPAQNASLKRKRATPSTVENDGSLDFFGDSVEGTKTAKTESKAPTLRDTAEDLVEDENASTNELTPIASDVGNGEDSDDEIAARRILKEHKLKIAWLNPPEKSENAGRKVSSKERKKDHRKQLYPRPLLRLDKLDRKYGVSPRLQNNIRDQGYNLTTEVQTAALSLLLDDRKRYLPDLSSDSTASDDGGDVDLLTVAPTGSGKTLAFLIPTLTKIAHMRRKNKDVVRHTTALILAPTKELVAQIVNEGRKLSANTGIKISQVRKGMHLDRESTSGGSAPEENDRDAVKVDILASTPGTLYSIIESSRDEESAILPAVQTLVLDEADVLLDPLFREQTLGILNRLPNKDLRVSFWSATMGSNIEELARTVLKERRERLSSSAGPERPLIRLVVGLKDSAVPNVQHKLVYAATEQGKLMGLRQLLHPATNTADTGPTLRPPFLVFMQTIERAVALHSELLYDIPAEAGGISRIAVLHSDLSDTARDSVMTRFRKGEVWVLITTDLLSRGVDFRGVNGVVNYDIPTSSAAYVHRVGRTGRAGREGGVAVTLYNKDDIPYLKHIANIIVVAQKQQGGSANGEGVQQWLLDALPSLSKNEKQRLKRHGVEARTAKSAAKDPNGAKKARISTKSGYLRRKENKRKGAILGNQRRAQATPATDARSDTDFGAFD